MNMMASFFYSPYSLYWLQQFMDVIDSLKDSSSDEDLLKVTTFAHEISLVGNVTQFLWGNPFKWKQLWMSSFC